MALSTKKINQIVADHKAGRFKTQTALLKHYKIDRKTLVKILEGISSTNTDIVDAGVIYENAKKSLKNPVEIKAIENVVRERTVADEIEEVVLGGTLVNVKGIKRDLDNESVSLELSAYDRKLHQETFDKALITAGKANRHAPKQDINLQQNQAQINSDIEGYEVRAIE